MRTCALLAAASNEVVFGDRQVLFTLGAKDKQSKSDQSPGCRLEPLVLLNNLDCDSVR